MKRRAKTINRIHRSLRERPPIEGLITDYSAITKFTALLKMKRAADRAREAAMTPEESAWRRKTLFNSERMQLLRRIRFNEDIANHGRPSARD